MSDDTETLLRAMYDAWRRQDLDFIAANLPDDVAHDIKISPEVLPFGGLREGKAAVVERLAALGAEFEIQSFDVGCVSMSGDHAAAEVRIRYRHRPTGEAFESSMAHIWTFRDGRREARGISRRRADHVLRQACGETSIGV